MQNKIIFSLIIEQSLVLFILLIHLSGFMNVSQIALKNDDLLKNDVEAFIENSQQYNVDKLSSKTVLVVIDALRVDHLVAAKSSLMKHSKQLMETKQGIGYLLKTASPTVTLPRIKSIITGSIPSFMDVIFNFASSEMLDENIIHSSSQKGLKIAFYGDETWLKLFPKTFNQWEGVTSFFVSDYTEVDNNVTRHLPRLFSEDDWDILILHYLGLDHIGHLDGSKSPRIAPKLKEMDDVIKRIHQYLEGKGEPYLLLVCGDHGMSDAGGHGGDSHSEIWTSALVVSHLTNTQEARSYISPSQRIRNQVDLGSTLALYLGIEIPVKNVGVPFFEILERLPLDKQLTAHYRVSKQLMKLAQVTQEKSSLAEVNVLYDKALHHHRDIWLKKVAESTSSQININTALNLYKEFEVKISSVLTENMESNDLPLLLSSSLVLIMVSIPTIIWTLFLTTEIASPIYELKMLLVTLSGALALCLCGWLGLHSLTPSTYVVMILFVYGIGNLLSFVRCFTTKFYFKLSMSSIVEVAIVTGVILHPFSLLATSFVEEEHFGFYFMVSVVYFLLLGTIACKRTRLCQSGSKAIAKDDDEFIEKDLINSKVSLLQPPISCPVLFNVDSRLFLLMNGRKNKGTVLHTHSLRDRYASQFLLISFCWALFRLLRAFNATGDKWKHLTHLNDLLKDAQENELYLAIVFGLLLVFFLFRSYGPVFVLFSASATLARHFPVWERGIQSGTLEAQIAYACLFSLFIYSMFKIAWYNSKTFKNYGRNRSIKDSDVVIYLLQVFETVFALFFLLLQRPENVLVSSLSFLHFHMIIPILVKNHGSFGLLRTHVYVFAFWIGQAHFFIEGNSNSLTTVQINAGFVGVTSYRPFLHGTLIACHTFGAKFLVFLHALIVNLCHDKSLERIVECLRCWWMLQLLTLTVYVINVTIQRHHLFIWSVFAPKLLYEESHFLCLMILTVLVFICVSIAKVVSG